MDLLELHPDLHVYIPAKRRAEDSGAEIVVAILGVAEHASEILRDVLEEHE